MYTTRPTFVNVASLFKLQNIWFVNKQHGSPRRHSPKNSLKMLALLVIALLLGTATADAVPSCLEVQTTILKKAQMVKGDITDFNEMTNFENTLTFETPYGTHAQHAYYRLIVKDSDKDRLPKITVENKTYDFTYYTLVPIEHEAYAIVIVTFCEDGYDAPEKDVVVFVPLILAEESSESSLNADLSADLSKLLALQDEEAFLDGISIKWLHDLLSPENKPRRVTMVDAPPQRRQSRNHFLTDCTTISKEAVKVTASPKDDELLQYL